MRGGGGGLNEDLVERDDLIMQVTGRHMSAAENVTNTSTYSNKYYRTGDVDKKTTRIETYLNASGLKDAIISARSELPFWYFLFP